MIADSSVSRRRFLQSVSTMTGSTFIQLSTPALVAITQSACTARQQSTAFVALDDRAAADFAAITARIIPTTDTPGATEAGVIHFIDNAFAAEMKSRSAPPSTSSLQQGLAISNDRRCRDEPINLFATGDVCFRL